jgi:hypothetical protein
MGDDAAEAKGPEGAPEKTPEKAPEKTPENGPPEIPASSTPAHPAGDSSGLPPVIVPQPDSGYTAAGVPTLEGVREKIETRYGTALGATELAEDTPGGRASTDSYEARQKAAADKLKEIRESMHRND